MAKELTPEQLAKKKRQNLLLLCNRISSAWSLKSIKTWADVYNIAGTPSNPKSGSLLYPELKQYFEELKKELEFSIANGEPARRDNPTITTPEPEQKDESGLNNQQDYGLPVNENFKAFLFWFQKKALKELLDAFLGFDVSTCSNIEELRIRYKQSKDLVNPKRGMLLLAATGTGKTFIAAALLRYLYDIQFHEDRTMGHVPYLYVTRSTIVEQTKRVFENLFQIGIKQGIEVINIEQLRSRYGEVWIKDSIEIVEGKEVRTWKWRSIIAPCVILWDESQGLKNDGSLQNEIACAYNNIKTNTFQVHISATPFTRVCEAKCFAVSTRKSISDNLGLGHVTSLNNENWSTYASSIAYPSGPDEFNEAAVERLIQSLDAHIVRVRGVRSQFDAINSIKMIDFETVEERTYYNKAWDRYLEEKAKLEKAGIESKGATGNSRFQLLVQFLKFRMAAEFCRRHHLAKAMYESFQDGNAAVCALNFKGTIIAVVKILNETYHIPRDQISLVWGGGQTAMTAKQKLKASVKAKAAQLELAGINSDDLLAEMDLDSVEDKVMEELPDYLRLGTQTKEDRQSEIDRFQSGKSQFCLFTFRAGGVGLSLHHTDELTKEKVRRQKNGYAIVEDIGSIPVRPRVNFLAPTYSAIELVQGLGRCPRLTSLSNTKQTLLFYRGTIEEDVSRVVSQKLRCLSKVVRQRETWADVVIGGVKAEKHIDNNVVEETGTNYDDLSDTEDDE
jgi:Type III restriction enzyme, res subunit